MICSHFNIIPLSKKVPHVKVHYIVQGMDDAVDCFGCTACVLQ